MNNPSGGWHINQGIENSGTVNVNAPVSFGSRVTIDPDAAMQQTPQPRSTVHSDLGVITVLAEEMRAVAHMLVQNRSYRQTELGNGVRFDEAIIHVCGRQIRVTATQTLETGEQSASIAFARLRQHYEPTVVVMTGIAGGIHSSVQLGDVVLALEVVSYDRRKETSAGLRRRGTSHKVPARVRHAINSFFSDNGEPCHVSTMDPDGVTRIFSILPGVIGSGGAVVADASSEIRGYLTTFNEKTLAVETETGGICQAAYETADTSGITGWLAVRGIADHADSAKDDRYHGIASWHAAVALERLAPYLVPRVTDAASPRGAGA
jgi:adenosylhomocysteine nucleosidase